VPSATKTLVELTLRDGGGLGAPGSGIGGGTGSVPSAVTEPVELILRVGGFAGGFGPPGRGMGGGTGSVPSAKLLTTLEAPAGSTAKELEVAR
jgi:hypothetical protein